MNTETGADKARKGRANGGVARRGSLWKGPVLFAAIVVAIPLVASRLVDGWHWRPGAFVVLGGLLVGMGFAYRLVTRNQNSIAYRAAVVIASFAMFTLVWGSLVQWADVNRYAAMYFAVPIVGLIGAAVARLRPTGMARALFVTALAQALVLAAVLWMFVREGAEISSWTPPEWRGFVGNGVVALLFAGSGLLFRMAAREEPAMKVA